MSLLLELLLALLKAFGLVASAKQASDERASGAAIQRAEDYTNEAIRIQNAARAGDAVPVNGLPDPFDRDAAP